MDRTANLPCLQAYCRLPNLVRRAVSSDKPCRVLADVPATEEAGPTQVLECPLCGSVFHQVSRLALWTELGERDVPTEAVEALKWNELPASVVTALEEGDLLKVIGIIERETLQRVEKIGKDITLVDGVPFFRKWDSAPGSALGREPGA